MLRQRASAPPSPQSSTQQDLARARKPIEAIRVGERVWADNPDVPVKAASQVDSARWRRLTLRIDARWEDGTPDEVRIETLQPPSWVRRQGAQVGALVPVPLDLQEMGLPEALRARVLANEPCPAIAPGPGCVVLTTVSHLNRDVRELTVADTFGRQESFRPTGFHKFYRPRDRAWVSAQELRPGDQLRGRFGRLTVVANKRVPGIHRVYNLTVEGEHVYHVSSLGALAHNMDCTPARRKARDEINAGGKGRAPDEKNAGGRGRAPNEVAAPTGPPSGWRSTQTGTTNGNSNILRRNLGLQKGNGSAAHHLVESTGRRAAPARQILDHYGIDINSAQNGVGLVGGKGAPANVLPRHHRGSGLHTNAGVDAVTNRLRRATQGISDWAIGRQAVLDELAAIRAEILTGTFP